MMDNGSSYYDLLKHPKWQRKRLEILEAANFTCERCRADDVLLHVHHSYYEKGLAPWEYPNQSLHCLCEPCHRQAQDLQTLLKRHIGRLPLATAEMVLGYAMGSEAYDLIVEDNMVLDVFSVNVAHGVGELWGLSGSEIWEALEEGKIDSNKLYALLRAKDSRPGRPRGQPGSTQ